MAEPKDKLTLENLLARNNFRQEIPAQLKCSSWVQGLKVVGYAVVEEFPGISAHDRKVHHREVQLLDAEMFNNPHLQQCWVHSEREWNLKCLLVKLQDPKVQARRSKGLTPRKHTRKPSAQLNMQQPSVEANSAEQDQNPPHVSSLEHENPLEADQISSGQVALLGNGCSADSIAEHRQPSEPKLSPQQENSEDQPDEHRMASLHIQLPKPGNSNDSPINQEAASFIKPERSIDLDGDVVDDRHSHPVRLLTTGSYNDLRQPINERGTTSNSSNIQTHHVSVVANVWHVKLQGPLRSKRLVLNMREVNEFHGLDWLRATMINSALSLGYSRDEFAVWFATLADSPQASEDLTPLELNGDLELKLRDMSSSCKELHVWIYETERAVDNVADIDKAQQAVFQWTRSRTGWGRTFAPVPTASQATGQKRQAHYHDDADEDDDDVVFVSESSKRIKSTHT